MGNKLKAYKNALTYVFTEIKKQGWLALLIAIISPSLSFLLDGNLVKAILFFFTIVGTILSVVFIWSFFYILEEYGKTLTKSNTKKAFGILKIKTCYSNPN